MVEESFFPSKMFQIDEHQVDHEIDSNFLYFLGNCMFFKQGTSPDDPYLRRPYIFFNNIVLVVVSMIKEKLSGLCFIGRANVLHDVS